MNDIDIELTSTPLHKSKEKIYIENIEGSAKPLQSEGCEAAYEMDSCYSFESKKEVVGHQKELADCQIDEHFNPFHDHYLYSKGKKSRLFSLILAGKVDACSGKEVIYIYIYIY